MVPAKEISKDIMATNGAYAFLCCNMYPDLKPVCHDPVEFIMSEESKPK
jgi:hypothetical protein